MSKALAQDFLAMILVPIFTYRHESWVMNDRKSTFPSISGRNWTFVKSSRRDTSRSCEIPKALNVVPLLQIKSCLRWFGHVSWMCQETLARPVLLTTPEGKRPRGGQWTRWRNYISDLAWPRYGVELADLPGVAEKRISSPRAAAHSTLPWIKVGIKISK